MSIPISSITLSSQHLGVPFHKMGRFWLSGLTIFTAHRRDQSINERSCLCLTPAERRAVACSMCPSQSSLMR